MFASTRPLTIAGGFVASLIFFFLFILAGNMQREVKWITVALCLFVTAVIAATVHRVSMTTCVLFSLGWVAWVNRASKAIGQMQAGGGVTPGSSAAAEKAGSPARRR